MNIARRLTCPRPRSSRFNALIALMTLAVILFTGSFIVFDFVPHVSLFSSFTGENSWKHYVHGGSFATASPSVSPHHSNVVLASPATGAGDLYLYSAATREFQRLSTSQILESSPFFRPGYSQVVFTRETVPYRHIWVLDLDRDSERQLTIGHVLDDIIQIAPDGKHLLCSRATNAGAGKLLEIHLIDIDEGANTSLPMITNARFIANGTEVVGTDRLNDHAIVRTTLDGRVIDRLNVGFFLDGCDPETVLVCGMAVDQYNLNYKLDCIDLSSHKVKQVGVGHTATLFDNGKVLFFSGFQHDAWIWRPATESALRIEAPSGYKYPPNRSIDGTSAGIYVISGNSRTLDAFIFDANTETFRRVYAQGP